MDRLLTPAELAQMLGLSVQTIYNRLNEGRPLPPHVRIGRLLRFRLSDVLAWIAALPTHEVHSAQARRVGRPRKTEELRRHLV